MNAKWKLLTDGTGKRLISKHFNAKVAELRSNVRGTLFIVWKYTIAFFSLLLLFMCAAVLVFAMFYQIADDSTDLYYGVIVDAGSTSSRLYVFYWKQFSEETGVVPSVYELETQDQQTYMLYPGIDKFQYDRDGLKKYLLNLTDTAKALIPAKKWESTPFLLYGTSGMRSIGKKDGEVFIQNITEILKGNNLAYLPDDIECVRVLSGSEESAYGWLGVNYLYGSIPNYHLKTGKRGDIVKKFVGSVDLGGGSVEIAFETGSEVDIPPGYNYTLDIEKDLSIDIYSDSLEGTGVNWVRDLHLENITASSTHTTVVTDPCMPLHYTLSYTNVNTNITSQVIGGSDFNQCRGQLLQFLNGSSSCGYPKCSGNGHFIPDLSYYPGTFVLHSGFGYLQKEIKFPSNATMDEFQLAMANFCSKNYEDQSAILQDIPAEIAVGYCLNGVWGYMLLDSWFSIDESQASLIFTREMNNYPVSWCIGTMVETLHILPLEPAHRNSFLETSYFAIVLMLVIMCVIAFAITISFLAFSSPISGYKRLVGFSQRIVDRVNGRRRVATSATVDEKYSSLDV